MILKYHRDFEKDYAKLRSGERARVQQALKLFQKNPFDRKLGNHALSGAHQGERAIGAGGDLRLIFREHEHYTLVLFLGVGSHNQVYWTLGQI